MSHEFELRSVHDSTRLRFHDEIPRGLQGYDGATFRVSLFDGPVTASVNVYDVQLEHWTHFFAALAASWRGWSGSKTAESLEGHLFLEATSDRAGHVRLRVRLRGAIVEDDWRAELSLHLEAGQLERIASDAARYFGRTSA
jgi:hypothetical protein